MSDTTKQFSLQGFRPDGFGYPVGLNAAGNQGLSAVEYLVVAGGGGGGWDAGGGGGAGGYRTGTGFAVSVNTDYSITVGAGGSGGNPSTTYGSNGSNSIFSSITSLGGGAGGGAGSPSTYFGRSGGYTIHTFTGDGTFATNAFSYSIN